MFVITNGRGVVGIGRDNDENEGDISGLVLHNHDIEGPNEPLTFISHFTKIRHSRCTYINERIDIVEWVEWCGRKGMPSSMCRPTYIPRTHVLLTLHLFFTEYFSLSILIDVMRCSAAEATAETTKRVGWRFHNEICTSHKIKMRGITITWEENLVFLSSSGRSFSSWIWSARHMKLKQNIIMSLSISI